MLQPVVEVQTFLVMVVQMVRLRLLQQVERLLTLTPGLLPVVQMPQHPDLLQEHIL
ncbi:hypothetical protein D3C87_1318150 [compost metagenome]